MYTSLKRNAVIIVVVHALYMWVGARATAHSGSQYYLEVTSLRPPCVWFGDCHKVDMAGTFSLSHLAGPICKSFK